MSENREYLDALSAHLWGHLPEELRRQRIEEIRSHLAMDQEERQASGVDSDSAARMARRALGSPEVLARQMVRQARGYDSASPAKLTLTCGIALTIASLPPYYFLLRSVSGTAELALHWLPFLTLVYFGFLVARTRRWLAWPMAAWSALVVAGACAISVVCVGPKFLLPATAKQTLTKAIEVAGGEERIVRAWSSGHAPSDQAPIGERQTMTRYYFPMIPFPLSHTRTNYSLAIVRATQAPALWRANGAAYAADVEDRLASLRSELAGIIHPAPFRRTQLEDILMIGVAGTAEQAAIFAIVNLLVLALSGVAARRRTRRDPLLA